MEAPVLAAIFGLVGGVVSGAIAAWVALRGKRLDRDVEQNKLWVGAYEKTLFEQRLVEYRKLWSLTEKTSRRHAANLSAIVAVELAAELTRWYYREGGILLTGAARNAYFRARESLEDFEPKQVAKVVGEFSSLRTALCEDLNSRNGPTLQRPDASGRDAEDYPETMFSRSKESARVKDA